MRDKPKPYVDTKRFGILNPQGDLWTSETFRREVDARLHLARFWAGTAQDPGRFKIVPVRVTVSVRPLSKGDQTNER